MIQSPELPGVVNNDLGMLSPGSADYEMLSPNQVFADTSNLIPAMQSMKGARTLISAKYFTQALPMHEQEAPLVDAYDDQEQIGAGRVMGRRLGIRPSQFDGEVTNVGRDAITIKDANGKKHTQEIYSYFPHAKKTFTNDRPLVKIGDRVKIGQALARSNFVTDDGDLAMGRNLRVAFMAAPEGSSFEDAIAVSRSAADKMTSTHLYSHDVETKHGVSTDKKKFISLFPNRFTKDQLAKLDENGMAKPGVQLDPGDPVMLSFHPRVLSSKDAALGNLSKVLRNSFEDSTVTWEKPQAGVVADSFMGKNKFKVNVATKMPLREGDKISARQGAKGVIGKIIPDDKMPHDENGDPLDIFINPAALIGRVNPAMVYEALLGKVANKTGQRYVLPNFSEGSVQEMVVNELAKNGVSDTETLTDPVSGRSIQGVLTGSQYFMKLEHTSEDKISGRNEGGVDMNEQPAKGGKEGAKRLGGLMDTALLAHGATEVLRDKQVYRGSKNAEMWRNIRAGRPLPKPEVPFIYNKYLNTLRAAGIRVDEQPDRVAITAMTDKDVDELAGLEVKSGDTIDEKTGDPVKGGLFDYATFGGPEQKGWGVINLEEPIPNPIMEDTVRSLLGLTEKGLRDVMTGQKPIYGKTGPDALMSALRDIDLAKVETEAIETVRSGRKTKRNNAIKQLNAVRGLREAELDATDLMITKVPVLPPAYRPAVKMGDMTIVSDANYLYKDLLSAKDTFARNKEFLPDEELSDERVSVYDAVKAVQGLGDPIHQETRDKGVKGFMQIVTGAGKGPKMGMFQSKVLGHPVNTVGRSVIIPDSRLDMDHVGIPEKMAWNMYDSWIMGRMVKDGMQQTQAAREIENKTPRAKEYLLEEMKERPVMYSRDPALHKFSIMGAYPVLVPGDSIRISPLVVGPFNADFDGDAMNVHVPISPEAVKEVREKLMPSQNLFSIKNRGVHYKPSQEFILGLYNATQPAKNKEVRRFKDEQEAIAAYKDNLIDIDTPIVFG